MMLCMHVVRLGHCLAKILGGKMLRAERAEMFLFNCFSTQGLLGEIIGPASTCDILG